MVRSLKDIKEVALIEKIAKKFKTKNKAVVVSIGDDAAVLSGRKDWYLLYTVDMLVESVHFKKNEDRAKVGYKAMAASVSDIAAMGGIPRYALVSIALPKKNADRTIERLSEGINSCAKRFNIDIIGGDTNRGNRLVIDVFMAGEVERSRLVLRRTARPGDHIFVSGPLGGAWRGKHLTFSPRVREARFLVENFKVTSMIDLSDGLGVDLHRLASASRIGALIFEDKIPRSRGVTQTRRALFDGEDYELLFTLSGPDALKLLRMTLEHKTDHRFYQIGRMTDLFNGVRMLTSTGRIEEIPCNGFRHF